MSGVVVVLMMNVTVVVIIMTMIDGGGEDDEIRDVPVIHPVPGKCWISHYLVLSGPGKIMGLSNKKKFFYFLLP